MSNENESISIEGKGGTTKYPKVLVEDGVYPDAWVKNVKMTKGKDYNTGEPIDQLLWIVLVRDTLPDGKVREFEVSGSCNIAWGEKDGNTAKAMRWMAAAQRKQLSDKTLSNKTGDVIGLPVSVVLGANKKGDQTFLKQITASRAAMVKRTDWPELTADNPYHYPAGAPGKATAAPAPAASTPAPSEAPASAPEPALGVDPAAIPF